MFSIGGVGLLEKEREELQKAVGKPTVQEAENTVESVIHSIALRLTQNVWFGWLQRFFFIWKLRGVMKIALPSFLIKETENGKYEKIREALGSFGQWSLWNKIDLQQKKLGETYSFTKKFIDEEVYRALCPNQSIDKQFDFTQALEQLDQEQRWKMQQKLFGDNLAFFRPHLQRRYGLSHSDINIILNKENRYVLTQKLNKTPCLLNYRHVCPGIQKIFEEARDDLAFRLGINKSKAETILLDQYSFQPRKGRLEQDLKEIVHGLIETSFIIPTIEEEPEKVLGKSFCSSFIDYVKLQQRHPPADYKFDLIKKHIWECSSKLGLTNETEKVEVLRETLVQIGWRVPDIPSGLSQAREKLWRFACTQY